MLKGDLTNMNQTRRRLVSVRYLKLGDNRDVQAGEGREEGEVRITTTLFLKNVHPTFSVPKIPTQSS